MKIIRNIKFLKEVLKVYQQKNKSLGFVPTMGALHNGHLSLIHESVKHNDYTLCSIYVNPKQFNNKQDLIQYPRSEKEDILKLEKIGCDILFTPNDDEINMIEDIEYNFTSIINFLEGAKRPGHFLGVISIVHKLFNIIQPKKAYFGEKDYQQLWIINSFVKKYNINTELKAVSTIRDKNGLALSSRNQFLTISQKKTACALFQSMTKLKELIDLYKKENQGLFLDGDKLKSFKNSVIEEFFDNTLIKLDYFEIIETENFSFAQGIHFQNSYRALMAAYVGEIRLIDNIEIN